jgi:hypothetical protein
MSEMKKCSCCGKVYPATTEYFTKLKNGKYGLHSNCKECLSLRRRWEDMRQRCHNPNNCNYSRYGARGITVCDEWLGEDGYLIFREWAISNGYERELSIDRINNDGNYEPSNCRWATKRQQNINKRLSPQNKTGYVGIRKHHCGVGWYGSVKIGNVDHYTGYSKDLCEAVRMRNEYITSHGLENLLNEVI